MKTLFLLLLLSGVMFAQQSPDPQSCVNPATDDLALACKQKESRILQDKIALKEKQRHSRNIAGMQCSINEAKSGWVLTTGYAIHCEYNGSDADVLGGPATAWSWHIAGPDTNLWVNGQKVDFVAKNSGAFAAIVLVSADNGHRQQSHSLTMKVNIPVEFEKAE